MTASMCSMSERERGWRSIQEMGREREMGREERLSRESPGRREAMRRGQGEARCWAQKVSRERRRSMRRAAQEGSRSWMSSKMMAMGAVEEEALMMRETNDWARRRRASVGSVCAPGMFSGEAADERGSVEGRVWEESMVWEVGVSRRERASSWRSRSAKGAKGSGWLIWTETFRTRHCCARRSSEMEERRRDLPIPARAQMPMRMGASGVLARMRSEKARTFWRSLSRPTISGR